MKPLPPPRRQRVTAPPPALALPGLGREALSCLSPAQIGARTQAATDRAVARHRRNAVQRLAERVAAVPAPKPVAKPRPAPTRRTSPPESEYTDAQADLLVRFADAYDAGQPVQTLGLTPDEVAVIYRHGARLRAKRQTF